MIAALCPAAAALAAVAQVYQWREADGTRAYSLEPPPDRVAHYTIREFRVPTLSAAQRARAEQQLALDREFVVASAAAMPATRDTGPAALDAAIGSAQAALAKARQARDLGREPRPGERLHDVGGGSRLSAAYYARQARLDEAVARARAGLDAAVYARADRHG